MTPYGLTLQWYDNPPFDGGGTTLRICQGDVVLHFCAYRDTATALKEASRLLAELSKKFVNSDGSKADIEKWRSLVRGQ